MTFYTARINDEKVTIVLNNPETVSDKIKQQMLEAVPSWLQSPALPSLEDPTLYVYADYQGYLYIGPAPIIKQGVRIPRIPLPEGSPYPIKLDTYKRISIQHGVDWRTLVVPLTVEGT